MLTLFTLFLILPLVVFSNGTEILVFTTINDSKTINNDYESAIQTFKKYEVLLLYVIYLKRKKEKTKIFLMGFIII